MLRLKVKWDGESGRQTNHLQKSRAEMRERESLEDEDRIQQNWSKERKGTNEKKRDFNHQHSDQRILEQTQKKLLSVQIAGPTSLRLRTNSFSLCEADEYSRLWRKNVEQTHLGRSVQHGSSSPRMQINASMHILWTCRAFAFQEVWSDVKLRCGCTRGARIKFENTLRILKNGVMSCGQTTSWSDLL